MAPVKKPAIAGSLAVAPAAKPKAFRVLKAKKPADLKKADAHPPYAEMINMAIVSLKERTGSSQIAIGKFIEEKQKDLPSNFKKQLFVQLKKLVAAGKLAKVKNSFKIAAVVKQPSTAVSGTVAVKKTASAPAKKKVTAVLKPKGAAPAKRKVASPKPNAGKNLKKIARTATVVSPGKKRVLTPVAKSKKVGVKVVRKPKSIKSQVKKAVLKGKK